MWRRAASVLFILTAIAISVPGPGMAEPAGPGGVVELFTSQSCSSCPPADELLGRLAERDNLLALSYSVDYWDYLDWKDTLADPAFSARQKNYAKARGDRAVYTPQAVINGVTHAVGSDAAALEQALAETAATGGSAVSVELSRQGDSLVIAAGAAQDPAQVKPATLWLVVYVDSATVPITNGENQGRTITYHNVVRRLEPIGTWTGEPLSMTVAMPQAEGKRCAVLLQEGSIEAPGRILATDRL